MHVIQRGNNRQPCFFSAGDHRRYLDWLREYAELCSCSIHAYVLMSNHVHLLVTPRVSGAVSSMMKRLGQRYVQHVNRAQRRSGTLWEGRFRSSLIEEDSYLLVCHRYIELNPVRAGIVCDPGGYRWSSYDANALGGIDPTLSPHPVYTALGATAATRREAYRALFADALPPSVVYAIRSATNGNFALGRPQFIRRTADAVGRRVTPGRPGPSSAT